MRGTPTQHRAGEQETGRIYLLGGFSVWTYESVELQFQHMRRPPFSAVERRRDLADRLTMIEGVSIPDAALNKRPSFGLRHLVGSGSLDMFLEAFDWVLTEIKNAENRLHADQR
jgi:hypothetical protein